ncbi:hypothetical protein GCM10022222_08100 [Amycolatopsis ultiminotia]|uniref:Uncharacterized protein n=1 Tax=Amycolatopsis ultiminotia TaxID=543629 RepID=A0ABP6V752_9PSEU
MPARVRLYRRQTDSSGFLTPRVLARVFPDHGQFEDAVRFYEHVTGVRLDMDLDAREAGLHIVTVGPFLTLGVARTCRTSPPDTRDYDLRRPR